MALTTLSEVKKVAQFTNEWDDADILTEIDIVEADIYDKYYLPKRSQFSIDTNYTQFYIAPTMIHEVIRIQVAVDSDVDPSGYLEIEEGDTTWIHDSPNNYITLASAFITAYENKIIRVRYTPKYANGMATYMVALNLIDPTIIVDGESSVSPLVTRIKQRIDFYKRQAKGKTILKSTEYSEFDKYEYISYSQSSLR